MNDHATSVRLAREWAIIHRRPRLVARANSWQLCDQRVVSLDELVRAVGGGGDRSHEADHRLRRLVAIARTDDLAARIVIERLTPGLLAIAGRYGRRDSRAFEELLATAWIAIRTYNPDRRPSSIAAALLSDAEFNSYRRWTRRRSWSEVPVDRFDDAAAAAAIDPGEELADLIEDAEAAGMCPDDLDLVQRLVTDASTEEIAKDLKRTSRAIRYRRERVTAALREIARAA